MRFVTTLLSFLLLAVSVSAAELNIYASGLRCGAPDASKNVQISYYLNAPATALEFQLLSGSSVVKTVPITTSSLLTKGQHTATVALAGAADGTYTWALEATGAANAALTQVVDGTASQYFMYSPRGLAVNCYPETDNFGYVYVSNAVASAGKQTKGIFVYDNTLTLQNTGGNGYQSSDWPAAAGTGSATPYVSTPYRVAIAEDGDLYISGGQTDGEGVWRMNNSGSPSFTKVSGTALYGISVSGTGSERKLYGINGSLNLVCMPIGNDAPYTGAVSTKYSKTAMGMTQQASCVYPDPFGGWWISQYRYTDAAANAVIFHMSASGTKDCTSFGSSLGLTNVIRGTMAVNKDASLVACYTSQTVRVYSVAYNASNVPTMTQIAATGSLGTNIDGIAFDYADNLYITSSSTEKVYVYATPKSSNTCITPAASSRTITISSVVAPVSVTSVSVEPTSAVVGVAKTLQLSASILPSNATNKTVSWASDNTAVATVDATGLVTGVAPGTATITATTADGGFEATCAIHVANPVAHVYAYDLNCELNGAGDGYTYSFKANVAATSGRVVFYKEGVEQGSVAISTPIAKGANSVFVAKSEMPQVEGVMTWAVELTAADNLVVVELTSNANPYHFYSPRGVAVDNSTESDYFGRIYITEPINGKSDGLTARSKAQLAGMFVFDPQLNELNPTNDGYDFGLTMPASAASGFRRVVVDEEGNVYVNSTTAIYKANPSNLNASEALFSGQFTSLNSFGIAGDDFFFIDYVATSNFAVKKSVSDEISTVASNSKWVSSDNSVISDGRGGCWISQYRYDFNTYPVLVHINATGTIDYSISSASHATLVSGVAPASGRGVVAINCERNMLALGCAGTVSLFDLSYDGSGVPTLVKSAFTLPALGSNIDGISFDYAGNLYVVSASTERFYMFSLPTNHNTCVVPAKKALTVEALAHVDVASVTINEAAPSIEIGEETTLTATVLPANASDPSLTWTSDNPAVATVLPTGVVRGVTAGTANITATADGVASSPITVTVYKANFDVTWVTNGAEYTSDAPANNEDLWQLFMPAYNKYYHNTRAEQSINNARWFMNNVIIDFMTNDASPWKWLGDYILPKATAAGRALDTEILWSFDVQAFFNQTAAQSGEYGNADFTVAGQPSAWLPYWKEANNYLPATLRMEDAIPAISMEGANFLGWYDNPSFAGLPVTSVTHDMTLYAKWENVIREGLTPGKIGTICLPYALNAGDYEGATFYSITHKEMKNGQVYKIFFEEVDHLEAGQPYVFEAEGETITGIYSGEAVATAGAHNGLVGTLTAISKLESDGENIYVISNNKIRKVAATGEQTGAGVSLGEKRAYINMENVPGDAPAPAPGRKRISLGTNETNVATDLEAISGSDNIEKLMIDGVIYIRRGEKLYDVTGRLVK